MASKLTSLLKSSHSEARVAAKDVADHSLFLNAGLALPHSHLLLQPIASPHPAATSDALFGCVFPGCLSAFAAEEALDGHMWTHRRLLRSAPATPDTGRVRGEPLADPPPALGPTLARRNAIRRAGRLIQQSSSARRKQARTSLLANTGLPLPPFHLRPPSILYTPRREAVASCAPFACLYRGCALAFDKEEELEGHMWTHRPLFRSASDTEPDGYFPVKETIARPDDSLDDQNMTPRLGAIAPQVHSPSPLSTTTSPKPGLTIIIDAAATLPESSRTPTSDSSFSHLDAHDGDGLSPYTFLPVPSERSMVLSAAPSLVSSTSSASGLSPGSAWRSPWSSVALSESGWPFSQGSTVATIAASELNSDKAGARLETAKDLADLRERHDDMDDAIHLI